MAKPHFKRVTLTDVKDGQVFWIPALKKLPDRHLPRIYRPGEPLKFIRVHYSMEFDDKRVLVECHGSVRRPDYSRRLARIPLQSWVWVEVQCG